MDMWKVINAFPFIVKSIFFILLIKSVFRKLQRSQLNQYIISGHIKLEKKRTLSAIGFGFGFFFAQAEKYQSDKQFFQTSFNIKTLEIYLVSFYAQLICSLIAAHSLP